MRSGYARPQIEILPDPQSVAEQAANWIAKRISQTSTSFRISLAGGNTPRALYRELARPRFRDPIDWRRLEVFWGDERYVPHDDVRSNYRMARETLLSHVPVPVERIHPIEDEGDIESAAREYEETIRAISGVAASPRKPFFDIVLLGVGTDGHTASLFPGDPALEERSRWVVPVLSRAEPRITLTFPAIQSSRAVAFLVTGEDKSQIIQRVLQGDAALPAARVRSEGESIWFLDRTAASLLGKNRTVESGPECRG